MLSHFNDLLKAQDRAIAKAGRQLNEAKQRKRDILKEKKDWIKHLKENGEDSLEKERVKGRNKTAP